MENNEFDVCVVGSGAGAGPVIYTLAKAGFSVLVLEKGPWFTEKQFSKDELACCRRSVYTPKLSEQFHVIEEQYQDESWRGESTFESGWDFWNGNCVGGSSNFMSGFFYRLKPNDFNLLSVYGPIKDANVVDWPIDYVDLEPFYSKVESIVGISGKVIKHPNAEPRSTRDFPYPPTAEHAIAGWFDKSCQQLKYHPLQTPRAVLSQPQGKRRSCEYSGYCGSYGCSSGAKGSARAALIDKALETGNCQLRANAMVYKLNSDDNGNVSSVSYYDSDNKSVSVSAKIVVVACQAIETARLLLLSEGKKHPQGLGNNHNQVGKNLVFSAGGTGHGDFDYQQLSGISSAQLKEQGPFVNRGLQDWYEINDKSFEGQTKGGRAKGGTIDFLFSHPNAIARAMRQKWDDDGNLRWGRPFQQQLKAAFSQQRTFNFEVFCDWLPNDNCFVSLDKTNKDKWGIPVANVRIGNHDNDLVVGRYLNQKAESVLKQMGAKNIDSSVSGYPAPNLVVGGCRFGKDPKTSVLDVNCRVHEVNNLYVTDGSFMPTGGSVPFTWTIYANAFRVAEHIALTGG